MAVEWFCQVMGAEVGPLTQGQLVDMVRQHQVNPEDLVRRGNSSWVAAFEVKGLFEAAAKPPSTKSSTQPENGTAKPTAAEASVTAQPASPPTPPTPAAPKARTPRNDHGGQVATADKPSASPTEDAKSASDWFCIASGEKQGPLRFDELKKLADDGSLRAKDRVWRGSWPKFRRASEVEELGIES